ncbi:MAG TPA: ABC transporter ATP-binding protein [Patescibacteria group bacterium]|nr:ABC transporter ATP-binding protein [Patescibacteria group bacterium]
MTGAGQNALVVADVCVNIGENKIINNCNFRVGRGEFVGIIGPNGAGKSTLLKGLRGMLPLVSGEVSVFDHPIHRLSDKKAARLIAYMQQEVNVGFGFTALELVLAGRYPYLQWWQHEREEDRRIAQKYMAFTGVEDLADKPVNQVSGGERQRILLAKVLAQETPLIFLDEPTASLDLVYQEEIFRYCQSLCKEEKSVLIIAHDIKLAAKFCSRLILLAAGKIVADGIPAEVLTVDNLERAYGLQAAVFLNKITGNLDIHTYAVSDKTTRKPHIHIIGGGGAAGDLMRVLYENNYPLTAGVLQGGDTDAEVAAAFGIDYVEGISFCAINAKQLLQHRKKIMAADLTVLGNICYGQQNIENLRAAFTAVNLILIEDSSIKKRDFTGGEATCLYRELAERSGVVVLTTEEFVSRINNNISLLGEQGSSERSVVY